MIHLNFYCSLPFPSTPSSANLISSFCVQSPVSSETHMNMFKLCEYSLVNLFKIKYCCSLLFRWCKQLWFTFFVVESIYVQKIYYSKLYLGGLSIQVFLLYFHVELIRDAWDMAAEICLSRLPSLRMDPNTDFQVKLFFCSRFLRVE